MRLSVLGVLLTAMLCLAPKSTCTPERDSGWGPPELIYCPMTVTRISPISDYELNMKALVYHINNNSGCFGGVDYCSVEPDGTKITLVGECSLKVTITKSGDGSFTFRLSPTQRTIDLAAELGTAITITTS